MSRNESIFEPTRIRHRNRVEAMPQELTHRLERCSATNVHDVLKRMGHSACALPPEIRPLDPDKKIAGPVFTVSGHTDYTIRPQTSLMRWAQMLSEAPPEHVLVCQPNNRDIALMGEFSAQALKTRGVLGYLVDGRCRDTGSVIAMGFPVFCIGTTIGNAVGQWTPDRFGEPITIGAITMRTGDWLLGDRDGTVVIPADRIEQVVADTEDVLTSENRMRDAILEGMDPYEAFLKYAVDAREGP